MFGTQLSRQCRGKGWPNTYQASRLDTDIIIKFTNSDVAAARQAGLSELRLRQWIFLNLHSNHDFMIPSTTSRVPRKVATIRHDAIKSQSEQAYALLRDRAISLEYKPGDYLNIASLADETGFGRTPINQALRRLASEGLVKIMPRKGVLVAPLSIDSALEMIEVRIVNERLGAKLAAQHINSENICQLRKAAADFETSAQSKDMRKVMNSDRLFHETIASIAGNHHLADILSVLHAQSQRFWAVSLSTPEHIDEVVIEHARIVDAISAGDSGMAADCVEKHIRSFREALMNRP